MFTLDLNRLQTLCKDFHVEKTDEELEGILENIETFYGRDDEESEITDSSTMKARISTIDFIILIILLSSWSLGEKIDLLLILYDMQEKDQLNLSEFLILLKSVLRVTR